MILESVIAQVAEQQKARLEVKDPGLKRELEPAVKSLSSHALIVSGIRRCGKSTLLLQMMKAMEAGAFYLNFEVPQLFDLSLSDFSRLDRVIAGSGARTLFFDEIQLVPGWEMYIRQKLDEEFRVVITGSNASLMSRELGTKLTGRHITQELFPFSYSEFLSYRSLTPSGESLANYMLTGGFPEYIKNGDEEQLVSLFRDVLIRDIVARHGIRDITSLQRLAYYLMANTGNRVTASKLKQPLPVGASSTILSWLSHLELSYLFCFVPAFSHSVKAQLINPRKVYAIDPGLAEVVSTTLTQDYGRKLENLVFLHLRRKYSEIYYFDDKGECDFVAVRKGKAAELVQVCYELTPDNLDRELNGLTGAMRFFNIPEATMVTFNNEDTIKKEGFTIQVVPAYNYLMQR